MAPVLQGYGMTENAAAACATPYEYRRAGTVGQPIPCLEVKLTDVPDMNYTSLDEPCPRGEVMLRGANVFQGYYKVKGDIRVPCPLTRANHSARYLPLYARLCPG